MQTPRAPLSLPALSRTALEDSPAPALACVPAYAVLLGPTASTLLLPQPLPATSPHRSHPQRSGASQHTGQPALVTHSSLPAPDCPDLAGDTMSLEPLCLGKQTKLVAWLLLTLRGGQDVLVLLLGDSRLWTMAQGWSVSVPPHPARPGHSTGQGQSADGVRLPGGVNE